MELIRTPVIPMITPTNENLVEGEIVNINSGKSIGVVKNGVVVDIIQDSACRILEDESISISSNIAYSNTIGYCDKDDKVLLYKTYGIVIDMNNSDTDECIFPFNESTANLDIKQFIEEFLGFKKKSSGGYGRTSYILNNFYYLYTIVDNKILFLISKGEMDNFHKAFEGEDTITLEVGLDTYDDESNNKFTFNHFMLFNSIFWLVLKTTCIDNLEKLKDYSADLYELFNDLNDVWIYNTHTIKRTPINSYISKYELINDILIPSEFEGSDKTYFCTKFVCSNSSEICMYFLNNTLITTDNRNLLKTTIKVG